MIFIGHFQIMHLQLSFPTKWQHIYRLTTTLFIYIPFTQVFAKHASFTNSTNVLHHLCNMDATMDAHQFQEGNNSFDINVVVVTLGSSLRGPNTSYDVCYGIILKITP